MSNVSYGRLSLEQDQGEGGRNTGQGQVRARRLGSKPGSPTNTQYDFGQDPEVT